MMAKLSSVLTQAAAKHGERPAVRLDDLVLSYSQLRDAAGRAAPLAPAGAIDSTVVMDVLKAAPAPAPATAPPTRNRARLGSHTAAVTAATPAASTPRPSRAWRPRDSGSRPTDIWARAAAPNTMNVDSPARACELWCRFPAMNPGASEVNSPNKANAAAAASPAA